MLSSSRNFQRVKVKSVKVTSMIPGVKNDISEQLKSRLEAEVRQEDNSQTTRDQLRNVKDTTKYAFCFLVSLVLFNGSIILK